MPSVVGSYIAIKFVELYTKDFTNWPAYKLGLIDKDGNKIKEAVTVKEKDEFVSWKNLIRKLKIVLNNVPLGQFGNKLATFASAFWLLKEEFDSDGRDGQEIINIINEKLFVDEDYIINEEIMVPGKFTIKDVTPSIVFIDNKTKILGTIFNRNIYEVKDIITLNNYIVSLEDLRKL